MPVEWNSTIAEKHRNMVANTPEAFQKLMEMTMRPKIESLAVERGSSIVEEEDFARGWLSVPAKGRPGVVKGLNAQGIDVEPYLKDIVLED